MDLGDLTNIQTTAKKLEELLGAAVEYEGVLRDWLHQTAARIGNLSGVDAADAPQRQLGCLRDRIIVADDFDGPG